MSTITRKNTGSTKAAMPAQRSYSEVVDFLDSNWQEIKPTHDLSAFKALDKALDMPSKATHIITVAGTNGKSLTINFSATLLHKEGLKVGAFYCPRVLTYNEQLVIGNETISNKIFGEIANDVINTALTNNIAVSSHEIMAMTALVYFRENNVDVALVEFADGEYDPLTICTPKILAITRVTDNVIPAQKKLMSKLLSPHQFN